MTSATSSTSAKVPRVLWAQRSDLVYLTIEVVEAQEEQVELTSHGLKLVAVQGSSGDKYSVDLEFYAEIDTATSQQHKTDRCFFFTLKKADANQAYWPRLLKTGKPHYVHTDFGRWKDEDEDDEEASPFAGMGGMEGMGGMGGMGGMMGGMGGMGGMDFSQFANMAGNGGFPMGGEDDEEIDADSGEEEGHSDEAGEEDPYQKTSKEALASDD